MSLDIEALRGARYCAGELIRYRRRNGQPIPEWLRRLDVRLDAEIQDHMSATGHMCGNADPDSELVGSVEVAAILRCSTRHVRRLAADLDGRRAGREWIFDRATVMEYAAARKE